ncbi:hypothetical protein HBH48_119160 [Parastagonospora nodorum]|nr:hypothetical protein HBH48_119160 [Parastagonospora nodorum]KAH5475267.1 hypothetical protein HBI28_102850 [Parastagonospora nodorum]
MGVKIRCMSLAYHVINRQSLLSSSQTELVVRFVSEPHCVFHRQSVTYGSYSDLVVLAGRNPTMESDYKDEDASVALDAELAAEEALKQEQKAERLKGTAERMKYAEEARQSLLKLYNQYRADPSGASKLCIGDCIKEISRRNRVSERIPMLSAAIRAVMQLLLDEIPHGDSKLNEVDKDGRAPLEIAISCGMLECVELLVEKGADLGIIPAERTSQWFNESYCSYDRIMQAVARKVDEKRNEKRFSFDQSPFTHFMSSSFRIPTVVPSNPLLSYRDIIYESSVVPSSQRHKFYDETTIIVVSAFLYMRVSVINLKFPCLVLDTIGRVFHERRVHGCLRSLPGYGGGAFDQEVGICLEQTLDESYYPSLDKTSLEVRNKDQIVSKEYLRTFGGEITDCPILMVPQIWLWRMDDVLLSAISEITHIREESTVTHFQTFGDDVSLNAQIGVLLAASVKIFGRDSQLEGKMFKPPLDMFEAALTSTLSAVHNYLEADRTKLKTKEQKTKELEFIHQISDVHCELDMIQSVLNQQKDVMDKFLADTKAARDAAENSPLDLWDIRAWKEVVQARQTLDQYTNRISKIHKDADRAEKAIDSFLNLQRTYANIEDTQNNMLVGLAALAFAIVTVIFTPLSFMTSLFALPVREILQHQKIIETPSSPPQAQAQSQSQAFELKYIGGYIALAGFATWIPTGILLGFLYLRWTGHFGRRQSRTEPKKDDATETNDTDAKESGRQKTKPWISLQEGLRRRWNVLKRRKIGVQAPREDTGTSTGVRDSDEDEASNVTPQASDVEGSKTRKKDTSIV